MKLSVEAILDVAQRIEQNAAVYYGKAAERFPEFADVMGQLQVMEVQHEQKFMKMQNTGLMQKSELMEQHQIHTIQFKLILFQKLREQIL